MSNKLDLNEDNPKPNIWGVVFKIVLYAAGLLAAYFGLNAAAHAL